MSKSAVTRANGHENHTGSSFDAAVSYPSNAKNWGDIIPRGIPSFNNGLNYATTGSDVSELRGYAIYTGGSYDGQNYAGKCAAMSAKAFYDIEIAAGQSSDSILADLNEMQASEDFALKATLPGGTFVGADPTALSSISASTRAPSSVSVGGTPSRASATLNGTLTVGSTSTVPSFLYGTTNPPTTAVAGTPSAVTGSGQTFSASVSGLLENTTYYVQALGTYEVVDPADATLTVQGTVPGEIISFVTPSSSKTNQTITFGALTGKAYGDPNFTLTTPTATSSLTVAVTSATPAVCTISTYTVTITGVGSCVLTANQAGNGTYNAAPAVEQSFTVSKGSQTITFGSIPPKLTSSSAFAVTPTASSGLTVSLGSSTTGICTVSSLTITLTGTRGTCTVTAAQAGNTLYSAATSVPQSFAVNADQTITFGSIPSKVNTFGSFTVAPTATSGLAVSLDSSTIPVCTVSGFTVSYGGTDGTCTLVASQAGNALTFYNAATSVPQSFSIGSTAKNARTITVAAGSRSLTYLGSTTLTSTASAGDSVGAKTYSVLTGPENCRISGATLTAIGVGNCTIGVAIEETPTYDAASSTDLVTISVGRATRIVTVASSSLSLSVGGTATLSSATDGGGTETFSLATGGSFCSVSGNTLTATATGSCNVQVTIATDGSYDAASSTNTVTITVNSTSRTITVATSETAITVGDTATLSSAASAGTGAKTYSILTGSSSCSLATTTVTGNAAGSCTVGVSIAADSPYGAATSSNLVTITVSARPGGGSTGNSGNGNGNGGGNSSSTPSAAPSASAGPAANDDKKLKPTTPTVSFPAPSTANGPTTNAPVANAGGNALRLEPPRVDPLPRAEVPMVTADNKPVTVTKATTDGPARAVVDDKGKLQMIVPIGYSGTATVKVEGKATDGSGDGISETIEVKVQGPVPAVVPNQSAADRPRLMPDKPGVVNVLGLDSEAALSWTPQSGAAAYEVYSDGKLVCVTVYSSCIVPALNNRSANYRVDSVSTKGRSLTIGTGTGQARAKGSLLGRIYFDSTESKLTKASRGTLKKMVNDLQAMGLRTVAVNGYTDALGSQRYNLKLSNERAIRVRTFLEGHLKGLIPVRKPFGEKQLIKDESRKPGQWQNRRVEIRVM